MDIGKRVGTDGLGVGVGVVVGVKVAEGEGEGVDVTVEVGVSVAVKDGVGLGDGGRVASGLRVAGGGSGLTFGGDAVRLGLGGGGEAKAEEVSCPQALKNRPRVSKGKMTPCIRIRNPP